MESMTGYGSKAVETSGIRLTVEMRGVNQKGLVLRIGLPPQLWHLEGDCRQVLRSSISRGRVDLSVRLEFLEEKAVEVSLSRGLAGAMGEAASELKERGVLERGLTFSDLVNVPEGVSIRVSPNVEDVVRSLLGEAVSGALEEFVASRQREGRMLEDQFRRGCERLQTFLLEAESCQESQMETARKRLTERLNSLQVETDPVRLEQEIVFMAQKSDTKEEVERFKAHLTSMGKILDGNADAIGKRLDHLFQEMQRELSTLLAKSVSMELTKTGLEMKLIVEQLREQVQNVC